MTIIFKLGIVLIIYFVLSQLILIVSILIYRDIIQSKYNKKKKKKKKKKKNINGGWHGGQFYAQPFLPITLKLEDVLFQKQIKNYNRLVTFFWINILTLFGALLLFNLGD